jgi:nucleoside-diphosphate-sugar epimerase
VYGPGEASDNTKKGALNYLIRKAQLGEPLDVYSGGNFFRDYLYVDDAVEALIAVALHAPAGELYLAGYGEPVVFKDLIECLHRLTGRKSSIGSVAPPRFHELVGIRNFSADTAKIRALRWAPKISLEEGLRRTLASYE